MSGQATDREDDIMQMYIYIITIEITSRTSLTTPPISLIKKKRNGETCANSQVFQSNVVTLPLQKVHRVSLHTVPLSLGSNRTMVKDSGSQPGTLPTGGTWPTHRG